MFVSLLISLYTSRLILQALGETDFGIYNVVGGIVVMFGFIKSSMNASTSRYLTVSLAKDSLERLKQVFSFSVTIHLLLALFIMLLAETIGLWFFYEIMVIPEDRINVAFILYQLSIVSTMIVITSVPFNASIISHERMGAFAYISISDVILKLVICYAVVSSPWDHLLVYGGLLFATTVINQIIYIVYCHIKFEECRYSLHWDKQLASGMLNFAGWNMAGNLGHICYTQGLNLLINVFFGPSANAARGIAVRIQGLVNQFSSNFQQAINPQITKSYAVGDLTYMRKLISIETRYSFYLLYLLSLPVLIEADTLLNWWLGEVPEKTSIFLRIMLITTYVESISNPLTISSLATGDVRLMQIVVTPMTLSILPISYLALKFGAPSETVFIITLIILSFVIIAKYWVIKRFIHITLYEYFFKTIFRCVAVGSVSAIIPIVFFYNIVNETANIALVFITCVISILITIYYIGTNLEERIWIQKKIKNIL